MKVRQLVWIIGLGCWLMPAKGQSVDRAAMETIQDSLIGLGYTIYNEPSEPERLKANFTFVKTLVSALKIPNSYQFGFDSLAMVSILRSPDDKFRVFSWHVPLNDGSYLYYGTIQLNTPNGGLKMYPLLDKTYEIESPERTVTTAANWYGAQYYRIIPLGAEYILLGWKGHTAQMTQKVIEVLTIGNEGVKLGKAIFDSDSTQAQTRMIYRYSRNARMYMDYDSTENRIVLDHLAPPGVQEEGQYEQYGPDMTYDAWQLQNGVLVLIPDAPMRNPATPEDDEYNDPRKPANHPKSGLSAQ